MKLLTLLFLTLSIPVCAQFHNVIIQAVNRTKAELKYHFWRLGEDGYVDSGVSATKLNGTPINNPTVSTDVM